MEKSGWENCIVITTKSKRALKSNTYIYTLTIYVIFYIMYEWSHLICIYSDSVFVEPFLIYVFVITVLFKNLLKYIKV